MSQTIDYKNHQSWEIIVAVIHDLILFTLFQEWGKHKNSDLKNNDENIF